MSVDRPVRVALIDPQPVYRSGMERLCRGDPRIELIGAFGTGQEALDAAGRWKASVTS